MVPGCPCPHKSPLSCRSSMPGWLLWLVCLHSAACRSAVNLGFCHQTGGLTAVCREASRQACTGLQSGLLRRATPALTSCITAQKPPRGLVPACREVSGRGLLGLLKCSVAERLKDASSQGMPGLSLRVYTMQGQTFLLEVVSQGWCMLHWCWPWRHAWGGACVCAGLSSVQFCMSKPAPTGLQLQTCCQWPGVKHCTRLPTIAEALPMAGH